MKQRKEFIISLPNGEKITKHYYSLAQARAHAITLCIQKYLDINKIIIKEK